MRFAARRDHEECFIAGYPLLPTRRRFWERVLPNTDYSGIKVQLGSRLQIAFEATRETAAASTNVTGWSARDIGDGQGSVAWRWMLRHRDPWCRNWPRPPMRQSDASTKETLGLQHRLPVAHKDLAETWHPHYFGSPPYKKLHQCRSLRHFFCRFRVPHSLCRCLSN
jgi:hypothetical protein